MGCKKLARKAKPETTRRVPWPRWTGFRGKTAWDWMQLLIVPVVFAVLGFLFTIAQLVIANLREDVRQQEMQAQQAQLQQQLQENKTPDAETVRHYIGKLSAAHLNLATANARLFMIMLVLSIVLLGVSGGIASAEGKLAVAGFGVKVPIVVFLTSAAGFLGVLGATRPSASYHESQYAHEINRLYKEHLRFEDRTQTGRRVYPLRSTSLVYPILQSLRSEDFHEARSARDRNERVKWLPKPTEIIFFLLLLFTYAVLPMAAVIGTGFKVAELLRASKFGWVWILFILWALFSCAIALFLNQTIREEGKLDATPEPIELSSRAFAICLLGAFLMGGGIGYFVAKVLGSP